MSMTAPIEPTMTVADESKPSFFDDPAPLAPVPPPAAGTAEKPAAGAAAPPPAATPPPDESFDGLLKELGLTPAAAPQAQDVQAAMLEELRALRAERSSLRQPAAPSPAVPSAPGQMPDLKGLTEVLGDEDAARKLVQAVQQIVAPVVEPVKQMSEQAQFVSAIQANISRYGAEKPSFQPIAANQSFIQEFSTKYGAAVNPVAKEFPELIEAAYYYKHLPEMVKKAYERGRISAGGQSPPAQKAAGTSTPGKKEGKFFEEELPTEGLFPR